MPGEYEFLTHHVIIPELDVRSRRISQDAEQACEVSLFRLVPGMPGTKHIASGFGTKTLRGRYLRDEIEIIQ